MLTLSLLFIYWLCWVFFAAQGLSFVLVSRGHSGLAVRGLIAGASLAAEHRPEAQHTGSVVPALGL